MKKHGALLSSVVAAACVGLVGLAAAGGGCGSGFATVPSSERIEVDLETPADQLPTQSSPRAISLTVPQSYAVKLSALKQDGSLDSSFNGYVLVSSKPGTVTTLSSPAGTCPPVPTAANAGCINGRSVYVAGGVGDQVTVNVLAAFGNTRIWAEDEGYVPVDPARKPPPQCSNGLDDNDNGKIDYPNDPGCYAADDDTENGGTYAAGASQPIWYQLPRIADVRGVSQGGTAGTSFPSEAVTMDTGYRGENNWTFAPSGCNDSSCAGTVVVYVSSSGFYATDLRDDDPVLGRGFGSVYAYNLNAPPNMRQCDRLRTFGGEAADFYGMTEINYPTWELEEWNPLSRPCLIPEPHEISPTCTLPSGQAVPNCAQIGNTDGLLKVVASLVRVESANGVAVRVGAHMGPQPACCGFDDDHPCCCGGADPKAPACPPASVDAGASALSTCAAAGQASTLVCNPTTNASNCDLNNDGKVTTTAGTPEGTCETTCDGDPDCSEYTNYLSENQFKFAVQPLNAEGSANGPAVSVQGDGSSDPEFDPVISRGQPVRSFTGVLFYFSGGTQFTIQARCADDIILDMTQSPIPSDTAGVHARTILDNDDGSN